MTPPDPGPLDRNDFATPTLMRSARGVYAQSMRAHLQAIGVDDLPRNGALILVAVDSSGGPRQDLPRELAVTKQAVSQTVDALVTRGYLERSPDPDDRRRVVLELTDRGEEVVEATMRGIDAVDRQLAERVSAEQVEAMRAGLVALTEIKANGQASAGRRRRQRQVQSFSPIFPVRDLADALAHYAGLGFKTFAYEEGDAYGFANREGTGLHLAAGPEHDPARSGSAYLYVRDADALYEEWSRPGIGGLTAPVEPTPYELREGSHVDPDGNLIRFGSPMAE
jgi:DNA-binding MarR family transcriptional regulator/catechol 2,3-dioxygenase-like lactoylglutathione lyase family enzyme